MSGLTDEAVVEGHDLIENAEHDLKEEQVRCNLARPVPRVPNPKEYLTEDDRISRLEKGKPAVWRPAPQLVGRATIPRRSQR